MLKELGNIRSYNDLRRVASILTEQLKAVTRNVSKSESLGIDFSVFNLHSKKYLTHCVDNLSSILYVISNATVLQHIADRDFNTVGDYYNLTKSITSIDNKAHAIKRQILISIEVFAKNHISKHYIILCNAVEACVSKSIRKCQYDTKTKIVSAAILHESNVDYFVISTSIQYINLKPSATDSADSLDFLFETFCIITTARINTCTKECTYYVNAFPEQKLPGTFTFGDTVNKANAQYVVSKLIEDYGIGHSVSNIIKNVKAVRVSGNVLTLLFFDDTKKSVTDAVLLDVCERLNSAFYDTITLSTSHDTTLSLTLNTNTFDTVDKYEGLLPTALDNIEARVALANDAKTFVRWYKAKHDDSKRLSRIATLEVYINSNRICSLSTATQKQQKLLNEYEKLLSKQKEDFAQKTLVSKYTHYINAAAECLIPRTIKKQVKKDYVVASIKISVKHIDEQTKSLIRTNLKSVQHYLNLKPKDYENLRSLL